MYKDRDLTAWRIFLTAAEAGSISRTADILDMDPGFISRTIRTLEKDLGNVPLFDRSLRPLKLTDNGLIALDAARDLLRIHQTLLENIDRDPHAMRGTLRVGLPPRLLQEVLVPFLVDFMKKYPEVNLLVTEYKLPPPVNFDTPNGRLDVICGYGEDPTHQNIVQIHYGHGPLLPCASPIYLGKHGTPLTPADLTEHIGITLKNPMRNAIRALCRGTETHVLRWKREIFFDSTTPALNAALFGAGIHPAIPALHCYQQFLNRQLVPVLPGWRPPQTELYLYARPEAVRLKRTQVFIEEYRAYIDKLHAECERGLESIIPGTGIKLRLSD